MRRLVVILVTLLTLSVAAPGVGLMDSAAEPRQTAVGVAKAVRSLPLTLRITQHARSSLGAITVRYVSGRTTTKTIVRSAKKVLQIKAGTVVQLSQRPAGSYTRFTGWTIQGNRFAATKRVTKSSVTLTLVAATQVTAGYSFVTPTATPILSSTSTPSPTPPPTATPTPTSFLPTPTLRQLADERHVTIATHVVPYRLQSSPYGPVASEVANEVMSTSDGLLTHVIFKNFDFHKVVDNWPAVRTQLDQGTIPYDDDIGWTADIPLEIRFAQSHHMGLISTEGLLWNMDLPDSLPGTYTDQQLREIFEYMIRVRMLKYPQFDEWSVVGEPASCILYCNGQGDFIYTRLGEGIIADAFHWAHETAPHATLALYEAYVLDTMSNDQGVTQRQEDKFFQILTDLKREGAPVDQVGLEDNFWIYTPPTKQHMIDTINRIKAMGYTIAPAQTTVAESDQFEYWPTRPRSIPSVADKDAAQAQIYADTLDAYLQTDSEFGLFEFSDAIDGGWPVDFQGLILDAKYQPKPAYWALVNVLRNYSP